jgi:L-amino acid N-acyltransferase YncA
VSALRLATAEDAAAIANIYRPIVESTAVSFETGAVGDDEMRRRIVETRPTYPWLVCDLDGVIAGYAYASRHRVRAAYQWSVDVSVYVDPSFRRRGVGRGLYTSLFAILGAQGFFNAFAGIALPNTASVALHESLGFTPIGVYRNVGFKLGAWHDVGWWQLSLRVPDAPVHPPLAMPSVLREGEWNQLLAAGASLIRQRR